MIDIKAITTGLQLNENGIWYSKDDEDISYPAGGNESCFAVEKKSFWFKHRNNCIISIVKSFPPENNGTIFDIGGGNGIVSLGLVNSGFNVALVEPGKVGALNAKKRGIKNVICATTTTAKFKQNSLPAVGLFDVLEHIDDDLQFLESVRHLVQKSGHLYLTVPSYSFLWSEEDVHAGHFRRYTLGGLRKVLQSAGYQIEFSSYIFRFLPLPILLFRTLPNSLGISKKECTLKRSSKAHTVKSGIKTHILNSILHSEINNLNNRKEMKFGGSCLVVAKCS